MNRDWASPAPASASAAMLPSKPRRFLVMPFVTPFHALHQILFRRAARPARTIVVVHNALPHEPLEDWRRHQRRRDGQSPHPPEHRSASLVAGELSRLARK